MKVLATIHTGDDLSALLHGDLVSANSPAFRTLSRTSSVSHSCSPLGRISKDLEHHGDAPSIGKAGPMVQVAQLEPHLHTDFTIDELLAA